MKKDAKIFIQHILESIEKIERYTKGIDKGKFFENAQLQDAIVRNLEIIGEAAKNVPEEFLKKYPDVTWSEMARMRDKLIHKYFGVDLGITWDTVKEDLPSLKEKLKKILEKVEGDE